MSFGADASNDTTIHQLRGIVHTSGGSTVAEDAKRWTDITRAIAETSKWLRDKTFLFLVDDVWDTGEVSKILQDIVSKVVLTTSNAALVFTTRDPKIARNEEFYQLQRKKPQSPESRAVLMRHAGYEEDSTFSEKAEEAISFILERTAGLPVAHSVAGKAVAEYALGCNSGMSPWVWYVSMNDSIIQSYSDRYSSLEVIFSTAIRSLKPKNAKSSSTEFEQLRTEDYLGMHRSLCVFQKQQWITIPVLVRLWGLEKNVVRRVCEEFVRVGLAERHDEQSEVGGTIEGIMIHDLLHDFATEEARRHETVRGGMIILLQNIRKKLSC